MAIFDQKHYVPILKAKQGEFLALKETFPATKDLMTPMLEVVNVPWDYENEEEAKTIEKHLEGLGNKIKDGWEVERRIFIDSNLIDGDRKMSDGATHHLTFIFNDLRDNELSAVPVTGLSRHQDYKDAVQAIVASDNRGVCLRIQTEDFGNAALQATIDTDLALYGLATADVDLVLDLGSIEPSSVSILGISIPTLINTSIPHLDEWRSFTLAATSFPKSLVEISGNTIDTIDRADWLLWTNLTSGTLARFPSFGDYAIAHPEMVNIDPRLMTVSASIRYTADTYWLVLKGRSKKKFGAGQYHQLCTQLIARPEYSGASFSAGDQYINDCAANVVGPGNPSTWRRVPNNHHFQKVIAQLSSLA